MKITTALAGVLIAGFAFSAAAQADTSYYVVKNGKTCTITTERPTGTVTVVENGVVYKTRTEAENAVKTIKVCQPE